MAVGLAQCHEDARHEGKMKGYMAFVLVTEYGRTSAGHWFASARNMRAS